MVGSLARFGVDAESALAVGLRYFAGLDHGLAPGRFDPALAQRASGVRPTAGELALAPLGVPVILRERNRFLIVAASAPAMLLLGHLLPAEGLGLALRLAGAGACVFLLPGAFVLRAFAWPSSPAVAIAASLALSLLAGAFALALVFAVGGSIVLAGAVLLVVIAAAAVPAARRGVSSPVPRADRRALAVVLGLSIPLAGLVWWATGPLRGDAYFHLARVRKLADFDTLSTLATVDEFKDGGLHPGYAFPLLHGADALVARLAGADPADVVLYLPAILVPLALVLAYGAGSAVFRSWTGGLAFAVVYAAHMGLIRRDELLGGTGLFELLAQPQAASLLLLAPAILALAFTFAVEGGRTVLVSLLAAAFALSAVHPTYTPYVALLLVGFLVARVTLVRGWEPLLTRTAVALAAILVPFGLYSAALIPVVRGARAFTGAAGASDRGFELDRYQGSFTMLGDWFGNAPSAIARGGPVLVGGLLAVPLAGFAARRLWAALVLGGSLAVLTVLLTPPLFTAASDALSLAQTLRLNAFLPVAFALVGGCVVLSRFRALGVAIAAGTGIALAFLAPGEFTYPIKETGPGWTVVAAVVGGVAALVIGAILRPRGPNPGVWTLAASVAFVIPVAVGGLSSVEQPAAMNELTQEIVEAVQDRTASGDVVFSDAKTAYKIAAFAPVYINAAPLGNTADTKENRRMADAERFFTSESLTDAGRRAILVRYAADWVLIDKRQPYPKEFLRNLRLAYEDGRYALYEVDVS